MKLVSENNRWLDGFPISSFICAIFYGALSFASGVTSLNFNNKNKNKDKWVYVFVINLINFKWNMSRWVSWMRSILLPPSANRILISFRHEFWKMLGKAGEKKVSGTCVPLVYINFKFMWVEWVSRVWDLPFIVILNRDSYLRTYKNEKTRLLFTKGGSTF